MLDDGNILLFNPNDTILRNRLQLGADKLLQWQKEDGSWEVAYDRSSQAPIFKELKDYRPTFYGMIVAYKILKDPKYLDAARKGADWYWEKGVWHGFFLVFAVIRVLYPILLRRKQRKAISIFMN